jgi:hypothetical protein
MNIREVGYGGGGGGGGGWKWFRIVFTDGLMFTAYRPNFRALLPRVLLVIQLFYSKKGMSECNVLGTQIIQSVIFYLFIYFVEFTRTENTFVTAPVRNLRNCKSHIIKLECTHGNSLLSLSSKVIEGS